MEKKWFKKRFNLILTQYKLFKYNKNVFLIYS